MAHPTSVTGSIGVIFIHPKLVGLMDKIGVDVEVSKSGEQKDMYSPFRETSEDESRVIQEMTDKLGNDFVDKVTQHRNLAEAQIEEISSGRVYLADEALNLGLIDRIGYLSDAVSETKNYAGLPSGARVVVYRRTKYPDDNMYNTALSQSGGGSLSLVNLKLYPMPKLHAGFYYLWIPGAGAE